MEIKINRDGEEFGPYTIEQVNELLADGTLLPTDLAWHDPMDTWAELSQVAAALDQVPETTIAAIMLLYCWPALLMLSFLSSTLNRK